MKYLETSMAGSYWIDCKFFGYDSVGKVIITYYDLFAEETFEESVDLDRVKFELSDRYENVITIDLFELGDKSVLFSPPVEVGVLDRAPFEDSYIIHYQYDFGMLDKISLLSIDSGNPFKIDSSMSDEEIVRRVVVWDLQHSFSHATEDPNYTQTHWALYGNLKDRAKITDLEND